AALLHLEARLLALLGGDVEVVIRGLAVGHRLLAVALRHGGVVLRVEDGLLLGDGDGGEGDVADRVLCGRAAAAGEQGDDGQEGGLAFHGAPLWTFDLGPGRMLEEPARGRNDPDHGPRRPATDGQGRPARPRRVAATRAGARSSWDPGPAR